VSPSRGHSRWDNRQIWKVAIQGFRFASHAPLPPALQRGLCNARGLETSGKTCIYQRYKKFRTVKSYRGTGGYQKPVTEGERKGPRSIAVRRGREAGEPLGKGAIRSGRVCPPEREGPAPPPRLGPPSARVPSPPPVLPQERNALFREMGVGTADKVTLMCMCRPVGAWRRIHPRGGRGLGEESEAEMGSSPRLLPGGGTARKLEAGPRPLGQPNPPATGEGNL